MSNRQVVRCPSCGAKNRVDPAKTAQGDRPICGQCKTNLPVDSKPIVVTDENFSSEVERSPLPILLDLWAPWCGPCRIIAPVLEELASELAGRMRIAKLNVDENTTTASRFNIRGIPTLLVLKDGKEVDRIVGVMPKADLKQRLERLLTRLAPANYQ